MRDMNYPCWVCNVPAEKMQFLKRAAKSLDYIARKIHRMPIRIFSIHCRTRLDAESIKKKYREKIKKHAQYNSQAASA